jgi:putative transposase
MRAHGIRPMRGYSRKPRASAKPSDLVPNVLQRQFDVGRPNRVWVTDITDIRIWAGWLYLAVVMDLFSRRIVGWAVSATIGRGLVLDAVLMAVRKRPPRKALIHSDQGSQHGSDDWLRFCRTNSLTPSMSRRGNCWDNAVAESFFSSLRKEVIKKKIYKNRSMARDAIAEYIDAFYSPIRRHSHLGGVSPEAFEAAGSSRLKCPRKCWKSKASKRSARASGSSSSCITTWDSLTTRARTSSARPTPSMLRCYRCLRNNPLPM